MLGFICVCVYLWLGFICVCVCLGLGLGLFVFGFIYVWALFYVWLCLCLGFICVLFLFYGWALFNAWLSPHVSNSASSNAFPLRVVAPCKTGPTAHPTKQTKQTKQHGPPPTRTRSKKKKCTPNCGSSSMGASSCFVVVLFLYA